jgi:MoaA/NifB/PqqE/SkfB family radical SAM enzyme
MLKRLLNQATDRLYEMPVLVLMPHSRCNCRCVMCDIWKGNQDKREITTETLEKHLKSFKELNVKRVALSGGEALMHSNLWRFCELLRSAGIKISLLSTGLTLKQHAANIVTHCDDVIVSIDGPPKIHDAIRNIPNAFGKLAEGVKELKTIDQNFRVTGRTVIQKLNYRAFSAIIQAAGDIGLNQISFLGADVSSNAFNRPASWDDGRKAEVALNGEEIIELEKILHHAFSDFRKEFNTRFIAEKPEKLLDIARHYRALLGIAEFPQKKCNAPWVSAVVESNGDVLPCFFHNPYGNLNEKSFESIINGPEAIAFRKHLNVRKDPTCQRCVCSLHLGLRQSV